MIGLSWFTEEEFLLLKSRAVDAGKLDDTYADWKANVANVKRQVEDRGITVVYVPLTAAEIDAFCVERGLENVGATRAELVSIRLGELSQ